MHGGTVHFDRRLAQLRQALEALLEPGPGRAETVQQIFSLEYDPKFLMKDLPPHAADSSECRAIPLDQPVSEGHESCR